MSDPQSPVVTKEHAIREIQRTAKANGGAPLGMERFEAETGIGKWAWYGTHWRKWAEALTEAGYAPNQWQGAFSEDYLLEKLAGLTRELGRFPIDVDMRMKSRSDSTFPSHSTFARLGGKAARARRLLEYCAQRGGPDDVISLCTPVAESTTSRDAEVPADVTGLGFVYLLKCGRFYKIGQTNATGRREYELSIQMPERAKLVHEIKTDDPRGIEAYWHKRFEEKRKNGEWFDLSAADVAAFRRRKFQ